jgi:DNA repair ATPase RecN
VRRAESEADALKLENERLRAEATGETNHWCGVAGTRLQQLATLRTAAERADSWFYSEGNEDARHAIFRNLRAALAQTAPTENPYAELVEAAQRASELIKRASHIEGYCLAEAERELDTALAKVTP